MVACVSCLNMWGRKFITKCIIGFFVLRVRARVRVRFRLHLLLTWSSCLCEC